VNKTVTTVPGESIQKIPD